MTSNSHNLCSDFIPNVLSRNVFSKEFDFLQSIASIKHSSQFQGTFGQRLCSFQNQGKVYNIVYNESYPSGCYEYRSLRIFSYMSCVDDRSKKWEYEASQRKIQIKSLKGECVYVQFDQDLNVVFILYRSSMVGMKSNGDSHCPISIFMLNLDNEDDDDIEILDLSSMTPHYRLSYTNIDQFYFQIVKGGKFLAVVANGFKYGFRKCHVDYSEGCVIDMIPYNKNKLLQPVLHFTVNESYTNIINMQSRLYVDSPASRVFMLFEEDSLYYFLEFTMDNRNRGHNLYTIEKEKEGRDLICFEQCGRGRFVLISKSLIKILLLHDEHLHAVKAFPLNLQHTTAHQLFNRFSRMLFSFYDTENHTIKIMDLNTGNLFLTIKENRAVIHTGLNWNMFELACVRSESNGNILSVDLYDIGLKDLSLKNLSRLALLKSFTKQTLIEMKMPSHLKNYLDLHYVRNNSDFFIPGFS